MKPAVWCVTYDGEMTHNLFLGEDAAKACLDRLNRECPAGEARRAVAALGVAPVAADVAQGEPDGGHFQQWPKPALTHLVYQAVQRPDGAWTREPVNQLPQKPLCEDCGGTGRQHVGYSGLESDGNAPLDEPCGSCGYAAQPSTAQADAVPAQAGMQGEALSIKTWQERFPETYPNFPIEKITPKDQITWLFAEIAELRAALAQRAASKDSERDAALLDALVKIKREADTGRVAYGVVALNEIIRIADAAMAAQQKPKP